MKELIIKYVTNENILKFAEKENVKLSTNEIYFIHDYILKNYKDILNNKIDYELIKNNVNTSAYNKIIYLIKKYKKISFS